MDLDKLRAWWFSKQGLDGSFSGLQPREVLSRAGWARSVGGANPYTTLFSRAGTTRDAADQAVADLQIHELPSARGCTYVLPAEDFALGLKVGQASSDGGDMATAIKFLCVTEIEIDMLGKKVVAALQKEALDPKQLKDAVGDAVRNLGDEGKKRGMTTTLPLALGKLQSSGAIRRVPVNGRLDQQRYKYAAWNPNPLGGYSLSQSDAFTALASAYFRWIGPATLTDWKTFSGLGVGASKLAIEPLMLMTVEDDWLIHPDEADKFADFRAPEDPVYSLVSSLDSLMLHHRQVMELIAPEDLERPAPGEKGDIRMIGGLQDLVCNAILDRGRIVGLWEFDPEQQQIVWNSFVSKNAELKAKVREMEVFVRDELGDCRSFSLDSPESRKPKLNALRALG